MFILAPVQVAQQYFMKFTPIFAGGQLASDKTLSSSASSKVLLREGDFDQAEVVRERVLVAAADLGQQLRHYQWRNRTEFPIVRVAAWQVRGSDGARVELEVLRESVPILMEQLADLPLFRALYLLKESLIACERLFQRFGAFRITTRMVGVNQAHKCRVWINENLASNAFQPLPEDEHGFLRQVGALFESKTLKGKTVGGFYGELQKCNGFAAALSFIDLYTKENRIAIPSFFKNDRLPEANIHAINKFHPSLTMTRSPRFISSLRDTLTPTVKHLAKEEKNSEIAQNQKVEVKQEVKPSLLALKKSAETRADIYGSNTMTFTDSKSREDLFQHHKFFSAQEIMPTPEKNIKMQKSEFLQFKPKGERPHKPTHRVTNRELFSCFTPQPQGHSRPQQQWDTGRFLSPAVEDKEGLEDELQSLFEKNHWQQRIDGLFGGEGELKRSVHAGEPQWRHNENDLPLLQHFGKPVLQSAIHDER